MEGRRLRESVGVPSRWGRFQGKGYLLCGAASSEEREWDGKTCQRMN